MDVCLTLSLSRKNPSTLSPNVVSHHPLDRRVLRTDPPREGGRNVGSGTARRSARQLGERGICKMGCELNHTPTEAAERAAPIRRGPSHCSRRHRQKQRAHDRQTFSSSLQHFSSSQVYAHATRPNSGLTRTIRKHPYSVTHSPCRGSATGSPDKLLFYRAGASGSREFPKTPEILHRCDDALEFSSLFPARRSGSAPPVFHKPFSDNG